MPHFPIMKIFRAIIPLVLFFFLVSFGRLIPIQKISMKMVARSLHKGKSVTANADVYYQTSGGQMVTHFTFPFEQVVITNSKGEYKNYDVKNNTIEQSQGLDYSSKNSFFYCFLTGKTYDMGLASFGYLLKDTKFEQEMVITTWHPPADSDIPLDRVEIVHENSLPVYMAFIDKNGKPSTKVYYSGYHDLQTIRLPLNITEFQYLPDGDSIISKRIYSDIKINEQVNNSYLDFKIPANAKLKKASGND